MEGARRGFGRPVVLGLLAVGVALAVVARLYRIPGSSPRLRMFPAEEELAQRGSDWTLPPSPEVPARPVARLQVLDGGSREPVAGAAFEGEGLTEEVEDAVRCLHLLQWERPEGAAPEARVRLAVPGRDPVAIDVPTRLSTRADGRDAPLFQVILPGREE